MQHLKVANGKYISAFNKHKNIVSKDVDYKLHETLGVHPRVRQILTCALRMLCDVNPELLNLIDLHYEPQIDALDGDVKKCRRIPDHVYI